MPHPLQQCASITNSLEANTHPKVPLPFPRLGPFPMKPYKSILQPINQAQIERYETINTEEVVRQVIVWLDENNGYYRV